MKIKQEDKVILRKLLGLFKPYIKNIIIIAVCMLLSAGLNTFVPLISKQIVDEGLIKNNFGLLVKLVAVSFLIVVTDQGIGFVETRYRVLISSKMPYELSKKAFKQIMKLQIRYFNNTNYGEIMNNTNMDVRNISRISDRSLFFIAAQVFRMIGGVAGLFLIDWKLTLIVLAVIPAKYKLVKLLARKRKEMYVQYMAANSDYSSWYGDAVSGVKEIKLLGIERVKTGEFINKQRKIIKIDVKMNILDKMNELSETVLFEVVTGLLYILGAYMIMKASFSVGGLMAFITYSIYVTAPISAVLNIGYSFSDIMPSAKRYFNFLDLECEDSNEKTVRKIDQSAIMGNIKFENISFKYNDVNKVLEDLSFDVRKGEKIAIIGSNGSGKTTLINLLLRFLKPDKGRILIDGIDISTIKLKEYRQLISVVSQNAYLFNSTVKENIIPFSKRCGKRVYKAAKESKANDFIEGLPQKYDTVVGSNGANLSGGQRQKIAVARAIAKESRILVLDEATSSYDIESEIEMTDLVVNRLKDKTVLLITHKMPILKVVDRIIFIEDGKVSACGKHDELYDNNSRYRNIIDSFNQGVNENVVNCS